MAKKTGVIARAQVKNVKNDKTLTPPSFTTPQCRYESTGTYTNPENGQVFALIVKSFDRNALEEFIKDVKVWFEARHITEEEMNQLQQEALKDDSGASQDDTSDKPETSNPEDIEVDFVVIDTKDVDAPWIVDFVVDPRIGSVNHDFRTPRQATYINAKATKTSQDGNLSVVLTGRRRKGPFAVNPNSPSLTDSSRGTIFTVDVSGSGHYVISGRWTQVSD